MVEIALERTSILLSYLWEMMALLSHARRLAAIRLAARRAEFERAEAMRRELDRLREFIRIAREMEQELAWADLTLAASEQVAIEALQAGLARLRELARTRLSDDTGEETPDEKG